MPARIFDENGIAALALHELSNIGMSEGALEDEEVSLPMPKLRPVFNKIRPLRDAVGGWKRTAPRLTRA